MEFLEIAQSRYSVRDYKSKKVEPEKLEKILQAAHAAPTAAHLRLQIYSLSDLSLCRRTRD